MAANKNLAEDPYERLANAIVLQAVTDYRVALKKIKANPRKTTRQKKLTTLFPPFRKTELWKTIRIVLPPSR